MRLISAAEYQENRKDHPSYGCEDGGDVEQAMEIVSAFSVLVAIECNGHLFRLVQGDGIPCGVMSSSSSEDTYILWKSCCGCPTLHSYAVGETPTTVGEVSLLRGNVNENCQETRKMCVDTKKLIHANSKRIRKTYVCIHFSC